MDKYVHVCAKKEYNMINSARAGSHLIYLFVNSTSIIILTHLVNYINTNSPSLAFSDGSLNSPTPMDDSAATSN